VVWLVADVFFFRGWAESKKCNERIMGKPSQKVS